jgi:hypothetical protein
MQNSSDMLSFVDRCTKSKYLNDNFSFHFL